MKEFLLISGMALVTFAARYPVLALLSRSTFPASISRALKYVPLAVLSAIIFPEVLLSEGELALHLENAPLFASLIAALVAWRSRNLLMTIVLGMASLWVWRLIFGG